MKSLEQESLHASLVYVGTVHEALGPEERLCSPSITPNRVHAFPWRSVVGPQPRRREVGLPMATDETGRHRRTGRPCTQEADNAAFHDARQPRDGEPWELGQSLQLP